MKKFCLVFMVMITCWCQGLYAQALKAKLERAVKTLESDTMLRHGILGLYVTDLSGQTVFSHNGDLGFAPASTQKILTGIAALDILGPDYRYKTVLYSDAAETGPDAGQLILEPSGDPTLGSWRWDFTRDNAIYSQWIKALAREGIKPKTMKPLIIHEGNFDRNLVPEGWIWQDIGNYYGAGPGAFNWRENQFDIHFKTSATAGGPVQKASVNPVYADSFQLDLRDLTTAAKGSGDNAYVYAKLNRSGELMVTGTLPAGESSFSISASHPDAVQFFSGFLSSKADQDKFPTAAVARYGVTDGKVVYTHYSPGLDSICYFFIRKSVNFYGEALLRTLAFEEEGMGTAEKGIEIMQAFWKKNGIDPAAIAIRDGSGLSPLNRVTPKALVQALAYARGKNYYSSFYNSLPLINNMKMKSGSIEGARAYAGYHRSKDGKDYIFAILVNNYYGSPAAVVKKMWGVLDNLK